MWSRVLPCSCMNTLKSCYAAHAHMGKVPTNHRHKCKYWGTAYAVTVLLSLQAAALQKICYCIWTIFPHKCEPEIPQLTFVRTLFFFCSEVQNLFSLFLFLLQPLHGNSVIAFQTSSGRAQLATLPSPSSARNASIINHAPSGFCPFPAHPSQRYNNSWSEIRRNFNFKAPLTFTKCFQSFYQQNALLPILVGMKMVQVFLSSWWPSLPQ